MLKSIYIYENIYINNKTHGNNIKYRLFERRFIMKKSSLSRNYIKLNLYTLCIIFICTICISSCSTNTNTNTNKNTSGKTPVTSARHRQIKGKDIDLSAGTFRGGKDIAVGLYDVTPKDGNGNFTVTSGKGDLLINEILGSAQGLGVNKVRVRISDGDEVRLQGISKTHFEPVSAPFVTIVKNINLYSGRFTAGEDIAAGRYKAAAPSGNGNFIVYDRNNLPMTNEILGGNIGVKDVTVDLKDGDIIAISSLNKVDLTPIK